jgi:hypothetical protein
MKITPNWRSRLRDYSTIALAAVSGLVAIWITIPADIKAAFPPFVTEYAGYVILALSVWGTAGKFIVQAENDN